jgi:hypothetical protein
MCPGDGDDAWAGRSFTLPAGISAADPEGDDDSDGITCDC